MPKPKGDPLRAEKWAAREAEWYYLAECAQDPHIASVCTSLAEQATTMKEFWSK